MDGWRRRATTTAIATSVLLLAAVLPAPLRAQTTSAAILGTVTDQTGGVLPGVTVIVTNMETGIARTVMTDDDGRYFVPQLSLGEYQVQADMPGFRSAIRRGIGLTLSREAVVDLSLSISEFSTDVVVTGEAALVESTNAMVAGRVSTQQMTDLPLNARSYIDLTLLQPATIKVRNPGGGFGDEGTHLTVAGSRPTETTFLLDGTVTTSTRGKAPASVAGTALGIDSIREFVVITSPYNAEYGRGSGGTVSVVSKSGTNRLHGSIFGFHRNEALDARNYFDPPDADKPPFSRNQFGFSLGGRIIANRTFYFGNYEGLRQELGTTRIFRVPTDAARRGMLPGGRVVGVKPAVEPYLALYPRPNGREFGDGTAEYLTESRTTTAEDFATLRIDHQLSASQSLFGRYTLSDASNDVPTAMNQFSEESISRSQYFTYEHKSILSSRTVNLVRVGVTRHNLTALENDLSGASPALSMQAGRPLPSLSVTPLSGLGSSDLLPRYFIDTTIEVYDSVNHTRGRHQLKAGFQFQWLRHGVENNTRQSGRWTFSSLENFLLGVANSAIIAPRELADPLRQFRQQFGAWFVQDDITLGPDVTLNVGLRSEWASTITETAGKMSVLAESDFLTGTIDDIRTGDPWYDNPGVTFAPRVGVAWRPFGDPKMSVRAGTGLFYDHVWAWWQSGSGAYRMAPFYSVMGFNETLAFPQNADFFMDLLRQRQGREVPAGNEVGQTITTPDKMPVLQYSVDVQRQLGSTTVLKVGYRGSRGWNQSRVVDYNQALPIDVVDGLPIFGPSPARRNPQFATMLLSTTDGDAFYNALLVELTKRFSGGFQFQGAYTLSKMVDDASSVRTGLNNNVGGGTATSLEFRRYDRGLSAFDVRQNFVMNVSVDLPFGEGRRFPLTGVADALLGGWQVNGIGTLMSGMSVNITQGTTVATSLLGGTRRPDLVDGGDNNPVLGSADQYFDPTQFSPAPANRYGNVGRNTLIGPGLATLDLSLGKVVRVPAISDGLRVSFRGELFNLLNRANFSRPSGQVFDGQGRLIAAAGRITSTASTARQAQVSVRVTW